MVRLYQPRKGIPVSSSISAAARDRQREPDKQECLPKKDGSDCHPAEKPACDPSFCNPDFDSKGTTR